MVYPVRSHRCGGNSDSIADIVTTNCEKSAEVIVPRNWEGLNNSNSLIEIYVSMQIRQSMKSKRN